MWHEAKEAAVDTVSQQTRHPSVLQGQVLGQTGDLGTNVNPYESRPDSPTENDKPLSRTSKPPPSQLAAWLELEEQLRRHRGALIGSRLRR